MRIGAWIVLGLSILAGTSGCVAPHAIDGLRISSDLAALNEEALIRLVEHPERLAIFPFRNRTTEMTLGVMASEVLIAEAAQLYLWDGAQVASVRDQLLADGFRWYEASNAVESRRIARRIDAEAYLIGVLDEYGEGAGSSQASPPQARLSQARLSGAIEIRRTQDDQLLWLATFVAEDRSVWRDPANPREMLRRTLSEVLERIALRLAPQASTLVARRRAEMRDELEGLKSNHTRFLMTEDREEIRRLEGILEARDEGDLPPVAQRFMQLRRLASNEGSVRRMIVQARYRERLASLHAGRMP